MSRSCSGADGSLPFPPTICSTNLRTYLMLNGPFASKFTKHWIKNTLGFERTSLPGRVCQGWVDYELQYHAHYIARLNTIGRRGRNKELPWLESRENILKLLRNVALASGHTFCWPPHESRWGMVQVDYQLHCGLIKDVSKITPCLTCSKR
jgi:hypothetical protein